MRIPLLAVEDPARCHAIDLGHGAEPWPERRRVLARLPVLKRPQAAVAVGALGHLALGIPLPIPESL